MWSLILRLSCRWGVERAAHGYTEADPGGVVRMDYDAVDDHYVPKNSRPTALIFGVFSTVLLVIIGAVVDYRIFAEADFGPLVSTLIVSVPSVVLLLACVLTWQGSTRARMWLMVFIVLDVFTAEALYHARDLSVSTILFRGTLPLNILALLALSSPSIQRWSERRKLLS